MFSLKSFVRFLLLSIIVFTGVALGRAQSSQQVQIIRVNTDNFPHLEIVVSVLDSTGKPVAGLTAKDFAAFEDNQQRTITSAQGIVDQNIPLSVILVVDVSRSMVGTPLADAKAAASTFVDQMRDIDEVGLVSFSNIVTEVQAPTKDKAAVKAKINALQAGGQTALYDSIAQAVATAKKSASNRRAIVLLTDGDEFGVTPKVSGSEAYQLANKAGIPIFTIGLGFSINVNYLQAVAKNTGGDYYASPAPSDLTKVYTTIATLLRSQYVLTVDTDSPANGSTHLFHVTTQGTGGATSPDFSVRYPAPIPVVSITGLDPNMPIDKPATATGVVLADNTITGYEWQIDGQSATKGNGLPQPLTINPIKLAPGKHSVSLAATDDKGHSGDASQDFQVSPLPPEFTIDGLKANETINADRTITLTVTDSQTPTGAATFSVDGEALGTVNQAPYSFTLPILKLAPGKHQLVVELKNATSSGTQTLDFNVAPGPRQTATVNALLQATSSARQTLTAQPSKTPTGQPTSTDTAVPPPSSTPIPPSGTPAPTSTVTITFSSVPPTDTTTPLPPSNTPTPLPPTETFTPSMTNTPLPSSTNTPLPTNTFTPSATFTPTDTSTPVPSATPTPSPTSTPIPPLTALTNVASSPIGLLCIGLLLLVLLVIVPLLFSGRRARR